MDIQEFIKETINQLTMGVTESAQFVRGRGGVVNPHFRGTDNIVNVKFDIALTVANDSEGNTGAKLTVAGFFNAGASVSGKSQLESVSRVQFDIPVQLPNGAI